LIAPRLALRALLLPAGNPMQLRHLKTFVAVARSLNFSRAAERLHLSQSTVSEQMQALESDLDAILFERSRRQLTLTPAGEQLLVHAQDLLRRAERAYEAVTSAATAICGPLRIGGLETLCSAYLPAVLATLGREYPGVQVELTTGDSGSLRERVLADDIDLAVVYGAAPQAGDLDSEVIAEEALLVLLPPGHRLASRNSLGSEDIAGEDFLVTSPGCVYRSMFEGAFASDPERSPRRIGQYASLATIRGLVEAGQGCALVPAAVLGGHPGRHAVPWHGEGRSTPIRMLWHRRRPLSPAATACRELARTLVEAQTRR